LPSKPTKSKPLPVQPAGAAGWSANGRGARWFAEDLPHD
jgi:hypothetical protein